MLWFLSFDVMIFIVWCYDFNRLGQVDVVMTLDFWSTNWTSSTWRKRSCRSCRSNLFDTISTETNVTARLEDNFERVRKTDRTSISGFRFRRFFRISPKFISKFQVLFVCLLGGLEEEEGCQGCDQNPEKFENSSNKMTDTSTLLGRDTIRISTHFLKKEFKN